MYTNHLHGRYVNLVLFRMSCMNFYFTIVSDSDTENELQPAGGKRKNSTLSIRRMVTYLQLGIDIILRFTIR